MDQLKTGKFIAELRRQNGFTQEALGEKIGVTNRTISRWENGNDMPDIGMFQELATTFDVSMNELLAGEKLSDEQFKQKANENGIAIVKPSVFSSDERQEYFKKKWRKDHISLLAVLGVISLLSILLPIVFDKIWLCGFAPIIFLLSNHIPSGIYLAK